MLILLHGIPEHSAHAWIKKFEVVFKKNEILYALIYIKKKPSGTPLPPPSPKFIEREKYISPMACSLILSKKKLTMYIYILLIWYRF